MALDADPYLALGLSRGASLDEVKRAYRRLAKANHPDAGGPTALPRFLAIQAAYEQIVGNSGGPASRDRAGQAAGRRPAATDPGRSNATRRAYGSRPRGSPAGTGPADARPTGAAGAGPTDRDRPDPARPRPSRGASEPDGAGRSTPRPPDGATGSGGGRRGKATLGSTSYDGADAGQFEPDWGGASWYGTTSGTYWTINPKEYADPRKHGPEYQARARRAGRGGRAAGGGDPRSDSAPGASWEPEPGARSDSAPGAPPNRAHGTPSWYPTSGPAGPEPGPTATSEPATERSATATLRAPRLDHAVPDPARAAASVARLLTDPGSGGLRERVLRALVGWFPIAFGLGWLVGERTGCGRFAATCDPAVAPLTAIGQGTILVALLLLPEMAALAAGASVALLAAAVAASLTLSATGGAANEGSRQVALGAVLTVAWISGCAVAVMRRLRGSRSGPHPPGPVS